MNRKSAFRFAGAHLLALVALALFPLYVHVSRFISRFVPGCALHDFLHLYCPLCGGTRAASALLRLDFHTALRNNALVVLVIPVLVIFYVIAWIRLFRGKEKLFRVPYSLWVTGVVILIVFGVFRNVLMIGWGIDPIGDLAFFWNRS